MKLVAVKYLNLLMVLPMLFLVTACSQIPLEAFNTPMVKERYQDDFEYKGTIEKKFAYNGDYAVDSLVINVGDDTLKNIRIWFPHDLFSSAKKWPLVVMANGTGVFSYRYIPIFKHLASWGFVVVGNDDGSSWYGKSTSQTLDYMLSQNRTAESLFFRKIDTRKIGLAGHSQGGMATLYAATQFPNSKYYKAICSMSVCLPNHVESVRCPIFFIGGSKGMDADMPRGLSDCFNSVRGQHAVMGMLKDTEHGDVLPRGDAYMTAWMLYHLQHNKEARMCFKGDAAEILHNPAWQHVGIK